MYKIIGIYGKVGWFAQVVIWNEREGAWWSSQHMVSGSSEHGEEIVRAVCEAWASVFVGQIEITEGK